MRPQRSYGAVSAKYRDIRKTLLPTCFFIVEINEVSNRSSTLSIFTFGGDEMSQTNIFEKILGANKI